MNEPQRVEMTNESLILLRDAMDTMLDEKLPGAVETGIKRVLTREAAQMFAEVFIETMKAQASVKVDSWAGAAVKGFFRKVMENFWLILFALAIAYSVGGLHGLVGAIKWLAQEALQ